MLYPGASRITVEPVNAKKPRIYHNYDIYFKYYEH